MDQIIKSQTISLEFEELMVISGLFKSFEFKKKVQEENISFIMKHF